MAQKGSKINVNYSELKKSIDLLGDSSSVITKDTGMLSKNKIPTVEIPTGDYSKIPILKTINSMLKKMFKNPINDSIDKLICCLNESKNSVVSTNYYLKELKSTLKAWDSDYNEIKKLKSTLKKNNSSKNLSKMQTNYKKLVKLIGVDEAKAYVKKLNADIVFSSNSKSILSFKKKRSSASTSTATSATTLTTVVSKPVAVSTTKKVKSTKSKVSKKATSNASAVASLKKALKNSLKNGDASAVSLYGVLVSAIGKKNASKYVSKLGYKARYKDGTVVAITKKNIQSSTKTTAKQTTNDSNNNETVIAQDSTSEDEINTTDAEDNTTTDTIDTGNNTEDDSNSNVDSDQNADDNSGTVTEVVAEEEPASDTSDTSTSSSNNENYNGDTSYEESSNNEPESAVSTDSESTENDTSNGATLGTEEDDSELDDTTTEKKASKVVTIDDDSDTDISESGSGKSSSLGVAVPLGLGAIGTGAAAVAGVRYIKNRHNNSEEYQDDYDGTSTTGFGEESQYVDSAQYESDDLYGDQYSGPAGSTYQDVDATDTNDFNDQSNSRVRYVDPEELESDNFKESSDVFNGLNSN